MSISSFGRAAVAKYHKLSVLKKRIVSQFWRFKVQGQGVSRMGSF